MGGGDGYTDELKGMVEAAELQEKVFRLEMTYHPKCIFAGLYGVKNPPQIVAVNTYNKMQRTSNANDLIKFIQKAVEDNESKNQQAKT